MLLQVYYSYIFWLSCEFFFIFNSCFGTFTCLKINILMKTSRELTVFYFTSEYGMGSKLSIEGDMYSFGILILEMLTGRRPTDEMFEDSHNLHNFVKISISNDLLQIVDPAIIRNELEGATGSGVMHSNVEKCLISLFSIALGCSMESPKERMSMVEVIRELNIIKSFFPTGDQAELQPQKSMM
jgi:serine/threonine protein kinase